MFETIMMVLIIVTAVVTVLGVAYIYLRDKSLQDIRADVYHLFLQAEHHFTETQSGKQKMKWVIQKARSLLPLWLQVILTDEFLYTVFQMWFDAVKDLLDDGKYNKSVEENEE